MLEDTIIVFTADHGDFMAEHNMAVKGGCILRLLDACAVDRVVPQGGDVPSAE